MCVGITQGDHLVSFPASVGAQGLSCIWPVSSLLLCAGAPTVPLLQREPLWAHPRPWDEAPGFLLPERDPSPGFSHFSSRDPGSFEWLPEGPSKLLCVVDETGHVGEELEEVVTSLTCAGNKSWTAERGFVWVFPEAAWCLAPHGGKEKGISERAFQGRKNGVTSCWFVA